MPYIIKGRTFLVSVIAVILATVLGVLIAQLLPSTETERANFKQAGIVVFPEPRTLPVLELQGSDGQNYQTNQLADDKWQLIFFGYTFCPDICPTTLAELKRIKNQLPESVQQQLQILMVTVDPERDSAQQLQAYLAFFDPQFLGLTGELPTIQLLSNATSIPFVPGDTSKPHYSVDHSGNLALINPHGQQVAVIQAPLKTALLVEQLPNLINQQ